MALNKVCGKAVKHTTQHFKRRQLEIIRFPGFLLKSRELSTTNDSNVVLSDIVNNKGILTLNRPSKLNSISPAVTKTLLHKLIEWENKVKMVIIKGQGRAFTSGGDIVYMTKSGLQTINENKEFFKNEFMLIGVIGQYPVPIVAIIDGITIGAGVGLSIHCHARIATERTLCAMPETMIGLYTDNGVGHVYSKMPYQLGKYLALTGQRINGTDVVKAGIATHYTKTENIPLTLKHLIEINDPEKDLDQVLLKHSIDVSRTELSLKPHLELIEKSFSAASVEEIIQILQKDGSTFALQTLEQLRKGSPTSLKLSNKLLETYKTNSLTEGLAIEYRLGVAALEAKLSSDFYEGARALLVDKDKDPKWNPGTLEKVTDEMIEKAFQQLPPNEELNFTNRVNELRTKLQANI